MTAVSIIIPAYNEEAAIRTVVDRIRETMRASHIQHEIIVVVDGATDATADEATTIADQVIVHPQNLGYGQSLKTGITAATNDLIAITDADGTYPVERLPDMIGLADKFHMVVGARTGKFYQGNMIKRYARVAFRMLSEFAAGRKIPDINSGLRIFRRSQIMPFFPIISAGFSFTTTSTLAYMLNGLFVHYTPIEYHKRAGRSKVRHVRDSLRAAQIIVEAILRCNPIKIFLLMAMPFVMLSFLLTVASVLTLNWICAFAAIVALATATIVLGFGFAAVAIKPIQPTLDPMAVNTTSDIAWDSEMVDTHKRLPR